MTPNKSVIAIVLLMLGGCGFAAADIETVPDAPTYVDDVRPLFVNHCLLCHAKRPARGAPEYFRLDVYPDIDGVAGAKTMGIACMHLIDEDEMPPAAERGDGVGPNGKKMFQKWVELGRPER